LSIEVILDDRNVDLMEEGIDVALRMGALADSGMTAKKVGQSPRYVVGTPAYFAVAGTPLVPADLIAHQAIVYEQRGGGTAWSFERDASEVAVAVSGRMRVNAAEGVRAAVLADMGVAISSQWMFAPRVGEWGRDRRPCGMGVAARRSMGGFPDRARGKCQGTRIRRFCRSYARGACVGLSQRDAASNLFAHIGSVRKYCDGGLKVSPSAAVGYGRVDEAGRLRRWSARGNSSHPNGRVPWPARIVKNSPSVRDCVGLTALPSSFRCNGVVDQACCFKDQHACA
jgi:hypothetical protein